MSKCNYSCRCKHQLEVENSWMKCSKCQKLFPDSNEIAKHEQEVHQILNEANELTPKSKSKVEHIFLITIST